MALCLSCSTGDGRLPSQTPRRWQEWRRPCDSLGGIARATCAACVLWARATAAAGVDEGAIPTFQSPGTCGFARLCTAEFSFTIWAQKTTLLERGCLDTAPLLTFADLADALRLANESAQTVGGTAPGNATALLSPQPQRRRGQLHDFFRNATVILQGLETRLPSAAAWARAFVEAFGLPCEISLYMTPVGSQGLSLHNDKHDVFAVQILGEKRWSVWDLQQDGTLNAALGVAVTRAPFQAHLVSFGGGNVSASSLDALQPLDTSTANPQYVEAQLTPGSLLYVPRGSLHVASTAGLRSGSSVHLAINIQTQGFSYAVAAYHAAAEPSVQAAMDAFGWDLQRFRRALMRLADRPKEGEAIRRSLPFGWVRRQAGTGPWACDVSAGSWFGFGTSKPAHAADDDKVHGLLQQLFAQILREAPGQGAEKATIQSTQPLEFNLPRAATRAAAQGLARQLQSLDNVLSGVRDGGRSRGGNVIQLPVDLHIAYVAWDVDDFGAGEMAARFSWCRRSTSNTAKARWPAAMLPMLQVIASSTSRLISLTQLGSSKDMVPQLLFALELERLPLDPPIRLLVDDADSGRNGKSLRTKGSERESFARNPDCSSSSRSGEL